MVHNVKWVFALGVLSFIATGEQDWDDAGDWNPDFSQHREAPAREVPAREVPAGELPVGSDYVPAGMKQDYFDDVPAGDIGGYRAPTSQDFEHADGPGIWGREEVKGDTKVSYRKTRKSYGTRVQESFSGVWVGFILMAISFGILFWNEGNYLRNQILADNVEKKTRVVPDASAPFDLTKDGELVLVTGEVAGSGEAVGEVLEDGEFGVTAPDGSLELKRIVEMYQWKEVMRIEKREVRLPNNVTRVEKTEKFTYEKAWSSTVIQSANFRAKEYKNPPEIKVGQSMTFSASSVKLGGVFEIGSEFKSQIPCDTALQTKVYHYNGQAYDSNPGSYKIGDTRVIHTVAQQGLWTIMGKQQGASIVQWTDPQSSKQVALIVKGEMSLERIVNERFKNPNFYLANILRFVGFLLMWFGLSAIWGPMVAIVDFIPVVGALVGFLRDVGTFIAASVLSILTISVAWLYHRPLWAGAVVLLCLTVIFYPRAPTSVH